VGERLRNLSAARDEVLLLAGVSAPVRQSRVYTTEPVGCMPNTRAFLNAAIEFEYTGDPIALIRALLQIEERMGRPRDRERNSPRSIDLDLLYCGDLVIHATELELPHPRIAGRAFVLAPLADIDPELQLPNFSRSVSDLLREADSTGVSPTIPADGW
jgi:2-amino-4-hydroxy-6-hydroxymethyldihydropteridine diphosphokinase